jgi:hypothetical protein
VERTTKFGYPAKQRFGSNFFQKLSFEVPIEDSRATSGIVRGDSALLPIPFRRNG